MTKIVETVTSVRCRTGMRITIVATILAVATTAAASRAKPEVMIAKGGTVTYHKLSRFDDDHSNLRLVLVTTSKEPREVSVPITVPAHFVVTGLTLSIAGQDPMLGELRATTEARQQYDDVVAQIKDPAIVERIDDHHVMVHVFPVSRDAAATIMLELTANDPSLPYVNKESSLVAVPAWAARLPPTEQQRNAMYAAYWPDHD
jgi:Vault protein inter-alpha-trypsin domain